MAVAWFTDEELNKALHAIEANRAAGSSISVTEHSLRQLISLDATLRPIFEYVQATDITKDNVTEREHRRYQADAGLRAIYSTAARFIDHASADFVAKKSGEAIDEMPMRAFVNNRGKLLATVDAQAALGAYGVQVYRNLLVEHEKVRKVPASKISKAGFQLSTAALSIKPDCAQAVEELWKLYAGATTAPGETNFWNRTRLLYDAVPLLSAKNQMNPDRKKIDDLCGEAGLDSRTSAEVIAVCVAWPKALAKAL